MFPSADSPEPSVLATGSEMFVALKAIGVGGPARGSFNPNCAGYPEKDVSAAISGLDRWLRDDPVSVLSLLQYHVLF